MTKDLRMMSIDELIAATVYVVEASSFEYSALWTSHHRALGWEENLSGVMPTIGQVAGRPVVLSLRFARLNGHVVMFQHATSQMVDYVMVEKWLDEHVPVLKTTDRAATRRPACDASNFHSCLHHLDTLQAAATA